MAHSWTYDAPSGTYKNHKISSDIRFAAIQETKFMQFVKPEAGYGKKSGESITITRVSNITVPTSGKLAENQRIPEDEVTLSTVAITVSEWGRAVPYTSLAIDLGFFDLENAIQKKLKDQMKITMDNAAADAYKGCKVKYIPTGVASGTFDTDGTASTTALANWNVYHVEQIRDYMYGTLFVAPYEGDDYVCIINTKGKRGIISDPAWETWHKYTDPSSKYNSEIGRIENIRFVETNNASALTNSGSSSVLGEGVVFGDDAVVMAVAEDPELLAETPKDFGRSKKVAWYGILEFGEVWNTANAGEAKIVHVTSA